MQSKLRLVLLFVFVALLFFIFGLNLNFIVQTVRQKTQPNMMENLKATNNPIFTRQSAAFEGTILSVTDAYLDVKNANEQKTRLPLSTNYKIRKYDPAIKQSTESADFRWIEANRDVRIYLDLINGEYKIVQIHYYK